MTSSVSNNLKKAKNFLHKGQPLKARKLCEKLLKKANDDAVAWHLLGESYQQQRRFTEALPCLLKSCQLNPKSAAAHHGAAIAHLALEQLDNAEEQVKLALQLEPNNIAVITNMAQILYKKHDYFRAAIFFKQALSRGELTDKKCFIFAECLINLSKFDEALQVAALLPVDSFDRLHIEGESYNQLNQLDDTLGVANKISGMPNINLAKLSLAIDLYHSAGEFDKAKALLKKQGKYSKLSHAPLYLKLGLISEHEIIKIEQQILTAKLLTETESQLAYKIAFYYKGIDKTIWFDWLKKANDLQAKDSEFKAKEITAVFLKAQYELKSTKLPVAGLTTKAPIFIFGMPRSGTTLTENILASHSSAFGCGESSALSAVINQERDTSVSHQLSFFSFVDKLHTYTAECFLEIGKRYLKLIRQYDQNAEHLVDKMPNNFILSPLLPHIFPQAKFIHVKRNPISNCLSIFEQDIHEAFSYGNTFAGIVNYYKHYEQYMDFVKQYVPEGSIYELSYEDLVSEPEVEIKKLLEYCELEFEPQCLDFHKNKRTVKTASLSQVRQGIYKSSIKRWEGLEEQVKELLDAFPEHK